jgi:hypothetical protein
MLIPEETVRCFLCHTTGSTIAGRFHPKQMKLGVTCEACHGPGQKHVDAMRMAQKRGITGFGLFVSLSHRRRQGWLRDDASELGVHNVP